MTKPNTKDRRNGHRLCAEIPSRVWDALCKRAQERERSASAELRLILAEALGVTSDQAQRETAA